MQGSAQCAFFFVSGCSMIRTHVLVHSMRTSYHCATLSPEWPQMGDNGGAHGSTPVKPIGVFSLLVILLRYNPYMDTSGRDIDP